MPNVIRLGDPTSHGGKVVGVAATHHTVMGIPVARLGDKCTCPKKGHKNCTIVEGDPNYTIDGVPVAFEGHKISCGATLIATLGNFSKG
ncbi:PAAR domain-containing protein [Eleftheria terrae]|uniref:PAAR domain-containing protein n=1 Tax=Eleftheria terrae TaxID=1597781 RepID=UPI00263B070C|nr:PAAR domain-containing protein [Eleftheria terrae]WKB50894.1 PAAR domain-containing protein [Eleftheria terrae]